MENIPTQEEQDAFMADFQELAKKHSLYVEAIPQYTREPGEKLFKTTAVLFLQKVTKKEEPKVVEADIVSPIQKDDLNQTA